MEVNCLSEHIRLTRKGKKKQPFYRIVAIDSRRARDGRFLETIGTYDPVVTPASVSVKEDRLTAWLNDGAQPSNTVSSLLTQIGFLEKYELAKQGKDVSEMELKTTIAERKKRTRKMKKAAAAAVEAAAAGVISSLTYFGIQIREAIKRKTVLRIGNILQIYFDPKNPLVNKIMGESKAYINSAFNEFSIENAELSPGKDGKIKRGRKIIQIYKGKSDMPTHQDLKVKASLEKASTGKDVEIIAIPSNYIKEMFEFDVKVVADKRIEKTRQSEQAVAMYKAQTYLQLGQGRVNVDEILANLMEVNGDDPTRLLLSLEEQDPSKMPENQQGQGQGQMPGGVASNIGNNAAQQSAGNQQRV